MNTMKALPQDSDTPDGLQHLQKLEHCPTYEDMSCHSHSGCGCSEYSSEKRCMNCNVAVVDCGTSSSSSDNFVSCESGPCNNVVCKNCSPLLPSFDCQYCHRSFCGSCVSNVPCSGSSSCHGHGQVTGDNNNDADNSTKNTDPNSNNNNNNNICPLSNCMECAENGNGDVLYCTHCGRGYCGHCKSMEFCYCLEGDVCHTCHSEMHDYDVECYWRHLPNELQGIVMLMMCGDCGDNSTSNGSNGIGIGVRSNNIGMEDTISGERLASFWMECIQFLPQDKDFDIQLYRRTRKARAATLILASYYLLKGQEYEAVYLILYAALLEEVWNRGSNYVKQVFEFEETETSEITPQYSRNRRMVGRGRERLRQQRPISAKILSIYFTSFHSVIENTATKANIIALLHNQLSSIREKEGRKLFECIDFALGKLPKDYTPIHSVPILCAEDYEQELRGLDYGDSLSMNIITSNVDNETKQNNFVYKDMTLGWWLKLYVIKCTYHQWLTSPIVTPSTNYFRVVHQGKTIFLSSSGKKTLHQLGVQDGDEIVFEGVESEEEQSITDLHLGSYESKTQEVVTTCTVCNVSRESTSCSAYADAASEDDEYKNNTFPIDTCHNCDTSACHGCSSSFFDCGYCGRLLCGECVLDVPCEGSNTRGCGGCLSNCMECAENGDGDVLYCTNCGKGYCNDCKPMDFCFCLVGDTCPECHWDMHAHDVEGYWQYLPPEIPELVNEYAGKLEEDELAEYWRECSLLLTSDKEFDMDVYREMRQSRAASLILASDYLRTGWDKKAVCLLLLAALMDEVLNRGANYITRVFGAKYPFEKGYSFRILSIYFTSFHTVVTKTDTMANAIAYLHSQIPSIQEKEGKDLLKCLDCALGKVHKSNTPLHYIPPVSASEFEKELRDGYHCNSLNMNLITSNLDNGRKEEKVVYKDMTLGWWLKVYVIKSGYQNWLRNQEVLPSTKYFRVVHKGKTLFLSSAGKKTLHQLRIRDGDEIIVGGVEQEPKTEHNRHEIHKTTKRNSATRKKSTKKNGAAKQKKKKKSQPALAPSLTEEQLAEKHRQEHSRSMTPVFEELQPLLKVIRNHLNDLTIKKAPKKRRPKNARKKAEPEPATASSSSLPSEDSLGGKAGKIMYSILVGEGLYNTSKNPLSRVPIVIDLHGCTRDEATLILDKNLPIWINTAMRGEYPWIIPVDIICGGGSQILSEVVQHWIRNNRHVANRPKGFV